MMNVLCSWVTFSCVIVNTSTGCSSWRWYKRTFWERGKDLKELLSCANYDFPLSTVLFLLLYSCRRTACCLCAVIESCRRFPSTGTCVWSTIQLKYTFTLFINPFIKQYGCVFVCVYIYTQIYKYTNIYIYIYKYIYIHVYMCVCFRILWLHFYYHF